MLRLTLTALRTTQQRPLRLKAPDIYQVDCLIHRILTYWYQRLPLQNLSMRCVKIIGALELLQILQKQPVPALLPQLTLHRRRLGLKEDLGRRTLLANLAG